MLETPRSTPAEADFSSSRYFTGKNIGTTLVATSALPTRPKTISLTESPHTSGSRIPRPVTTFFPVPLARGAVCQANGSRLAPVSKQLTHRFVAVNAANRIRQQLRARQHGQLREEFFFRHRNRIETHDLTEWRILKSE